MMINDMVEQETIEDDVESVNANITLFARWLLMRRGPLPPGNGCTTTQHPKIH